MSIVNEKSEAKWLTAYWFPERNELSVHWEGLPKGMTERRGVIRLTGLSHKGDTIATDSVVVVQQSAYIALHPDKLTFGKQGGTQVVIIDSTNVESINALRTYWKANKLNVTAYSFEYDGQRIGNDNHFREKTFRKHATFTYEQSDFEDFYFNIIFKDGEAFSDWIKR